MNVILCAPLPLPTTTPKTQSMKRLMHLNHWVTTFAIIFLSGGSMAIAQGVEDTRFKSFFIASAGTGLLSRPEFPAGLSAT